jgi:DNA adenine methylase
MTTKVLAFGYYGGKYSHLSWLLPLLPKTTHYCEPFAGSAAVLLNREPSPVETYNDIDGEVVNFFRVLRNHREEFIEKISLTPFSREEFRIAIEENREGLTDLERARRFFIRARQVRTGLAQTASIGRWANCLNTSRRGMSGAVSRYFGSIDGLYNVSERLLRVQIENLPAIDVIKKYDSIDTFFYCDPPYPPEIRGDTNAYGYELDENGHKELASVLLKCKGKVAISGYKCNLLDKLYEGWQCIQAPVKVCHSVKKPRQEVLYVNYNVDFTL